MKHGALLIVLLGTVLTCGCDDDGGTGTTGPSNKAPVIQSQADTSVALGDTLVIWADARDSDGDELTYTAIGYLSYDDFIHGYFPDAGMNATTGRFEYRPQEEDGSQRRFMFHVDDGRGGADSTTFRVDID